MKVLLAILALAFVTIALGDDHGQHREFEHRGNEKDSRRAEKEFSRDDQDYKKEERAASSKDLEPKVGHWNVTSYEGIHSEICIRMDAGIKLDVTYETKNGSVKTTTIVSDDDTRVNSRSFCKNGTLDRNETLALRFGIDRLLVLSFSRDSRITGDSKEEKWDLYNVEFSFRYDQDFPDAKESGSRGTRSNEKPLSNIASTRDRSYGCTKMDPIKVTDQFTVTFNNLRLQPFMTAEEFGQTEWCSKEQTSDLIPIIIGAALAALVIIVLIAYLVGRARSKNTSYDNI